MQQAITTVAATAPAALIEPTPPKKTRISKRLAKAIGLLVDGTCRYQKDAAERAGLRADSLSDALHKPHVRVFFERRARESIAAGTMRASARLIGLLDAGSEHVSLDAAKHVLGIAGIKPVADAQVSVNVDIKAGWVIDLGARPSDAADGDATANVKQINNLESVTP